MFIQLCSLKLVISKHCYHSFLIMFIWPLFSLNSLCNSEAANLVESGNKLQLALEINRKYVVPLDVEGKPGKRAIEKIIAEGFRCNLEPISLIGLDEPARSICIKKPSGFGKLCDQLYVTLSFEPVADTMSRETMLHEIETLIVSSALSFCPYEPVIAADFLATQKTAESELSRHVKSLELTGNAKRIYEKLLIKGFYCGFETIKENEPANDAKLVCSQKPSGIKNCYESKVTMDVDWGGKVSSRSDLFLQMESAKIMTVKSICEIPLIKAKEPAL